MDGSRSELFPRASFAADKHCCVRGGDSGYTLIYLLHSGALTNHFMLKVIFLPDGAVFSFELLQFVRIFQGDRDVVGNGGNEIRDCRQ